jgi:hypothetical protein
MQLSNSFTFCLLILLAFDLSLSERKSFLNKSENEKHLLSRQKRFLIFPGGGVAKYVGEYYA